MSDHPPLTHHAILGLAAPFARSARVLDLAASDRAARRLVFQPGPDRPATASAATAMPLRWMLDCTEPGRFQLTRTVQSADHPPGQLQADGDAVAPLLARVDAVDVQQQLRQGPGWRIGLRHQAVPGAGGGSALLLTEASAWLDGPDLHLHPQRRWQLHLRLPAHPRLPAELQLTLAGAPGEPTPDAAALPLPDDLLAVLGRSWGPLDRRDGGWRCSLQLRGKGAERSRCAEARLQATASHLARTLADPPRQFHQRLLWARWGVVLRRLVPLAVSVGLIAGAALLPRLGIAKESNLLLAVLNAPPLLLIAFFCLREVPRIGIPPLPRPLLRASWWPAGRPGHDGA